MSAPWSYTFVCQVKSKLEKEEEEKVVESRHCMPCGPADDCKGDEAASKEGNDPKCNGSVPDPATA